MRLTQDSLRLACIVLFCLLNVGFGWYASCMPLLAGGAVGICYCAARTGAAAA